MNIVIPMAGSGSRFKEAGFEKIKPLIKVGEDTMISQAVTSLGIAGKYTFIIREGDSTEELEKILFALEDEIEHVEKVKIIKINYLSDGPACTALLAKDIINSTDPLVIANCDQIMNWNGEAFKNFCLHNAYDGVVVTYYADTPKNSYAKLNKRGLITEIKEKEIISNISLNGIHFWKKGSYYVESAETMISENKKSKNGEFYIGPTYNEMINMNMKVGIYHVPNIQHNAIGTPEDLDRYFKNENN